MKRANSKSIATAIAVLSLAILSGCGSNPQSTSPVMGANGSMYPGMGGIGGGGCAPISQPISFQAQGVYADYANLVMGRLPSTGQQVGQVAVGTGAGVGAMNTGSSYATYPGRSNGAMSLTLGQGNYGQVGLPYSGYPYGSQNVGMNTTPLMTGMNNMYSQYPSQNGMASSNWNAMSASATGVIQLSAAAQQQIMYLVQSNPQAYGGYGMNTGGYNQGYNQGYNTGYGSNVCVSSIAMNIGKWDSYRLIYGGTVYLYLNGSTHGYAATF